MFRSRPVDFTRGGVLKNMLIFTVPVFFANVFSSLYSIVDATVVGRFVGAQALAAVNASYALNMVLVALCAGLGIGTSVVISQYYGSRQMIDVARSIGTALTAALSICAVLTVFGLVFAPQLLRLLNTPEEIMADAVAYFRIVMVGFAGQLLYGMSSGLLRGVGDSSFPALCVVVASVLNIVLDVVFVAALHWGVAGVAWATVIAHYLSAALPLRRLLSARYGYQMTRDCYRIRLNYLKTILRIGLFAAMNMAVSSVGMMLIQAFANGFGTDFVAANGVVQKVDSFAILPMSTIGGTVSTFSGQVRGASQLDRARKGSVQGVSVSCAFGAVIGVALYFLAPLLLRLFISTSDPRFAAVSDWGVRSIRVLAFFYLFYALQNGLYCILQGAGALRPAATMTAVGMAVRVALTWLLAVKLNHPLGLFRAMNIYHVLLCVLYGVYLKFGNVGKYAVVRNQQIAQK